MVEANHEITRKDSVMAMIPFAIYSFIYFLNVVILKRWEDHYLLNTLVPALFSAPAMYLVTYAISTLIMHLYNHLHERRTKQLRAIWDDNLEPTEIKIEIYSLGFHAGLHQDKDNISVPYGIIEDIANTFDINLEELLRAYILGIINGIKEKESK